MLDNLAMEGIHFRPKEMVQSGWYRMYLEEKQAALLVTAGVAELRSIVKQEKANILSSEFYRVFASENWQPNLNFLKRISPNIYIVKDRNVISDPHVLSVVPHSKPKLLNRFNVGFLFDGNHEPHMDGNKLWNIRKLHTLGLNGTGEIVGVVDSGLDVMHCMFYDSEHPTPINITNMDHRKVVRYEAIGDSVDPERGHGTHVCGILAGKAACENCGLGLYDGVAIGAKLYMHDLGDLRIGPGDLGDIELPFFMEKMREVGSFIASNSWGFGSGHNDVRMAYSEAAFQNPDVLFVFAAGNSYRLETINVPGNSKNVLSTGCATPPGSAKLAKNEERVLYIRYGSNKIEVVKENKPDDSVYPRLLRNPIEAIVDVELVNVSATVDVNGKVVNLANVDEMKICQTVEAMSNARAVITDKNVTCSSAKIPLLTVSSPLSVASGTKVSIYPELKVLSKTMARAALSSQGPSDLGFMKPEVMAPGDATMSASAGPSGSTVPGACDVKLLNQKTGTSMAAPAISGLMALTRQYFLDGWYKLLKSGSGASVKPLSTLLKAVAANAAVSMGSPLSTGYGIPILEKALGFQGLGLKFANNCSIGSKAHHVFRFTVGKNGQELSVSMAYLDPPLPPSTILPLFADLDMVLVTPSGKRYYGNDQADSFATTEKVHIESASAGTYEIHIFSSEFGLDYAIPYSVFVNGAFSQNEEIFPTVAKDCSHTCVNGKCSNGICKCQRGYTGNTCEEKITHITLQSDSSVDVDFKKVSYFWFTLSNDTFTLKTNTKSVTRAVFCFKFEDSAFRISEPNVLCYRHNSSTMELTFSNEMIPAVKTGAIVNLAVFGVTSKSFEVKFAIDNLVVGNMVANIWFQLPVYLQLMIISSCGILVVLVIFMFVSCIRSKRHREVIDVVEPVKTIQLSDSELDQKVDFDFDTIEVEA